MNSENLLNYDIVFWDTGDKTDNLNPDKEDLLIEYLDNGGSLLVIGGMVLVQKSSYERLASYLGLESYVGFSTQFAMRDPMYCVDQSGRFCDNGTYLELKKSNPSHLENRGEQISYAQVKENDTHAFGVYSYFQDRNFNVVFYDSDYRAIYFGLSFLQIWNNQREDLINSFLSFLSREDSEVSEIPIEETSETVTQFLESSQYYSDETTKESDDVHSSLDEEVRIIAGSISLQSSNTSVLVSQAEVVIDRVVDITGNLMIKESKIVFLDRSKISVSGTVDIDEKSTLTIGFSPEANEESYTIITSSGGISGEFESVQAESLSDSCISGVTPQYSQNQVDLVFSRTFTCDHPEFVPIIIVSAAILISLTVVVIIIVLVKQGEKEEKFNTRIQTLQRYTNPYPQ
mgnify:CR=1 FL=1